MKKQYPKVVLIIALIIFLILMAFFFFHALGSDLSNVGKILNDAGSLGSFIGGVFSFLSVVLIYFTIVYQLNTFKLSQFESKFYEMIRLHNENVQNFKHKLPNSKEDAIQMEEGNRVFMFIGYEILFAVKKIIEYLKEQKETTDEAEPPKSSNNPLDIEDIAESIKNLYTPKHYSSFCEGHELIKKYDIKDICEFILYDLAYTVVFYGLTREGRLSLDIAIANKYNLEAVNGVLDYLQAIPTSWDEGHKKENIEERIEKNLHFKYFGGHQDRLDHYYRQFHYAVQFVNNQSILNYEKKNFYLKLYRAQLSTHEQVVLFFNSLSDLGRSWEYDLDNSRSSENQRINQRLITKYDLIKNISWGFVQSYRIDKYYPHINYNNNLNPGREKLLAKYR